MERNLALFTINASYSRPTRRKNSRISTRQITPIHEPANIPREVMCHDLARKHASIVFQFQSIDTLHEPVPMSISIPPISMPPMSMECPLMEVLELMAEVAVAVELIDMDMSISILAVGVNGGSGGRVGEKEKRKR